MQGSLLDRLVPSSSFPALKEIPQFLKAFTFSCSSQNTRGENIVSLIYLKKLKLINPLLLQEGKRVF